MRTRYKIIYKVVGECFGVFEDYIQIRSRKVDFVDARIAFFDLVIHFCNVTRTDLLREFPQFSRSTLFYHYLAGCKERRLQKEFNVPYEKALKKLSEMAETGDLDTLPDVGDVWVELDGKLVKSAEIPLNLISAVVERLRQTQNDILSLYL